MRAVIGRASGNASAGMLALMLLGAAAVWPDVPLADLRADIARALKAADLDDDVRAALTELLGPTRARPTTRPEPEIQPDPLAYEPPPLASPDAEDDPFAVGFEV